MGRGEHYYANWSVVVLLWLDWGKRLFRLIRQNTPRSRSSYLPLLVVRCLASSLRFLYGRILGFPVAAPVSVVSMGPNGIGRRVQPRHSDDQISAGATPAARTATIAAVCVIPKSTGLAGVHGFVLMYCIISLATDIVCSSLRDSGPSDFSTALRIVSA